MRRVVAFVRRPAVALLIVFSVGVGFFQWWLDPRPRFAFWTDAVTEDPPTSFHSGTWHNVLHVSDDGSHVVLETLRGRAFRNKDVELHTWDVRSGTRQTPPLWGDEEWQDLLSRWDGRANMCDSFARAGCDSVLNDPVAWYHLRQRFTAARAKARDDMNRTLRPIGDDEVTRVFPNNCTFSPDAKLLAYVARNGFPMYFGVSDSLGDSTIVEETLTGRRVATLPGVTDGVVFNPDGRTAVSRLEIRDGKGELPRMVVWNLGTSKPLATLSLPEEKWFRHPIYSDDGRYVFAYDSAEMLAPTYLRWWDARTGRQLGEVENPGDWHVMDSGRLLVTHPRKTHPNNGAGESYRLIGWDMASGANLWEWNLDNPQDDTGRINDTKVVDAHHIVAVLDPDYARSSSQPGWFTRWLGMGRPSSAREEHVILLWDIMDRREVARFRGSSPQASRNGRWLGTIEKDGLVRVWELSIRRPWNRVLGYAAAVTLVAGVAVRIKRRYRKCQSV